MLFRIFVFSCFYGVRVGVFGVWQYAGSYDVHYIRLDELIIQFKLI